MKTAFQFGQAGEGVRKSRQETKRQVHPEKGGYIHRRLRRRLYYGTACPWCAGHLHAPPPWFAFMEKPTREDEIEDLKEHIAHLKEDLKAAEEGLKELEKSA